MANARKCQLEDFFEKGMSHVQSNGCSQQTLSAEAEKGNLNGSDATTRFPRVSCFEKPTRLVPETWGRMYDVLALRN